MKRIIFYLFFVYYSPLQAGSFQEWADEFKKIAIEQGVNSSNLDLAFKDLTPDMEVIALDENQNLASLSIVDHIKKLFTLDRRITQGKLKIEEHKADLDRISQIYQVPAQYIIALWGVETRYGEEASKYSVIRSLATLSWKSKRAKMFQKELILALKMIDQKYISLEEFKGSWAGATGQCQFMPSSFFRFCVPIGKTDIWKSAPNVFECIANYLKKSGWKQEQPWGHLIILPHDFKETTSSMTNEQLQALGVKKIGGGDLEFPQTKTSIIKTFKGFGPTYLVYPNFKVILRWNKSEKFALSVGILADGLAR
jgi:membrane-bound lytic murein transglycosylase B